MSIEEKLHKKMVKIMLGGVVKLETPQKEKKVCSQILKTVSSLGSREYKLFFSQGLMKYKEICEKQKDLKKLNKSVF